MNIKRNQTESRTAILIFARPPKEEMRYKQLHASQSINLRLHTALYNKTIQVAKATGLPVFIADKSVQTGNSFGERLAHSIDVVFRQNYSAVITIGNDCPQLSTEILLKAAGELNSRELVLGPDRNGGVYLIGISASLFNATIINAIPWQSKNVFLSLCACAENIKTDATILSTLSDFNKLSEYYFFRNILSPLHSFIKLITAIIFSGTAQSASTFSFRYNFIYFCIKQFRGPPAFC